MTDSLLLQPAVPIRRDRVEICRDLGLIRALDELRQELPRSSFGGELAYRKAVESELGREIWQCMPSARMGLGMGLGMDRNAGFSPASVAGCVLVLDYQLGVSLSGSNVLTWTDTLSGYGHVFTSGASKPTYDATNGIRFLRASTQYMTCPTVAFLSNSHSLVARLTQNLTNEIQFLIDGSSGGFSYLLSRSTGGVTNVSFADPAYRFLGANTSGAQTLSWVINATAGRGYGWRNSVAIGDAVYDGTGFLGAPTYLCAYHTVTHACDCYLKRLALFDQVISDSDRLAVENWAAAA